MFISNIIRNSRYIQKSRYNYNSLKSLSPYCKYFSTICSIEDIHIGDYADKIYKKNCDTIYKSKKILNDKVIATIGYGPQGSSQSLNLRSNGIKVILGLRKNGNSWKRAIEDGWKENKDIFPINEAVQRGNIIQYLLSDAAQMSCWPEVKNNLSIEKTLYFSHGLSIVYPELTGVIPPDNVNVIMIAPKGCGNTVRKQFLNGSGINGSWAVHQNYTGDAVDICMAMGFLIGMKTLFPTTFKKEVYSDLTGERSLLMGLFKGAINAQYNILRNNGHSSPS